MMTEWGFGAVVAVHLVAAGDGAAARQRVGAPRPRVGGLPPRQLPGIVQPTRIQHFQPAIPPRAPESLVPSSL